MSLHAPRTLPESPGFGHRRLPATGRETAVIVEVPHASVYVPPECLALMEAKAAAVGRDADLYVDELYAEAPALGATLLIAGFSRYVVDLNRGPTDVDEHTVLGTGFSVKAPRGVVWRLSGDNQKILTRALTHAEFEERLRRYYLPYHQALDAEIARKIEIFGHAIVLSGHSMPSVGGGPAPRPLRAEVVPGTQGRTTASAPVIDAVDGEGRRHGFVVIHDDPYRGGFVTKHHGRPRDGVHAIQVELSRRLYMDEATLRPVEPGFSRVKALCSDFVRILGRVTP